MHLTHDQISKARKARHMTQKQLASAMNVSRQTVSHWENGRMQPGEEAAERLCAVLGIAEDGSIPVSSSASQASSASPVRSALLPFFLGVVCGALIALLAVYVTVKMPAVQAPASQQTASSSHGSAGKPADDRYSPAFYQQENIREDGKAHLVFSLVKDPITVVERDREPYVGWEVDYRFQEVNNVGFTITSFTEVYFTADGEITYSGTFKGEELSIPFDNVNLPAGERIRYSGFKPVDATVLYGACIEGVDENGNERLFRYAIPLSQENRE